MVTDASLPLVPADQARLVAYSRARTDAPLSVLVQLDGDAAALFDALHALLPGRRLLVGAVEGEGHGGEALGFAERARLERALLSAHVSGDVEGVALSVAEAVDDGAADAALLVDGLFERLRLAPVALQVAALGDVQRLLTGLQNLLRAAAPASGARGRLLLLLLLVRLVRVVLVRVRDRASVPLGFGGTREKKNPDEEQRERNPSGGAHHRHWREKTFMVTLCFKDVLVTCSYCYINNNDASHAILTLTL